MLGLKPESVFALSEHILLQALPEADHFYAFDVKSGDHFKLNNTAHWVLESIGVGARLDDLVGNFADDFGLEPQTATEDLYEVVSFALENKIIKEVGP